MHFHLKPLIMKNAICIRSKNNDKNRCIYGIHPVASYGMNPISTFTAVRFKKIKKIPYSKLILDLMMKEKQKGLGYKMITALFTIKS